MSAPTIEQLQELPLPAPASYLPQTWGWWLLLAMAALGLAAWLGRRWYHWRQDRYRRIALKRLDQLQQQLDDEALREVPTLLKRVALSMPGQPDVASLSGKAWQAFLESSTQVKLPEDFAARLGVLAYGTSAQLQALTIAQRLEILRVSRQWVGGHHVAA